ncbi:hypothetical protein Pmani_011992 [Petrolisthes manimaculis]|uniref:Major facilitator superfamily (MFS) profile domain-containing protein n=1 Tax=Petrolisthes manimaculis TaxID=1843537 RepID=A0AAE1PZX2_9EUCA|nr:hypothetical protein Pmani_011992 [Petrolisthes manimaculis]
MEEENMVEETTGLQTEERKGEEMEDEDEATRKQTEGRGEECQTESPSDRRKRLILQVVMVLGGSVSFLGISVAASWPNPAILDLRRHNTTIYNTTITLTPHQTDMLGSMVAVGILPGTWTWGWLVSVIGRRKSMMLLLAPYTLAWGLVALAPGPVVLLIGRVVHGVCIGATFVSASTYIIELPDTSIRGALATVPNFALNLGAIFTVTLGFSLRWYEVPFVGLAVILLQTILLALFLPESPSFLVIKGRTMEAKRVLLRLRGPSIDVEKEMENILTENGEKAEMPLLKVLREPAILRSLAIVITLFFVQNFCGLLVFPVNMTRIFQDAGTDLSSEVATIIVFLVQMSGTVLACIYLDRLGRKPCLVFSLLVMAMSLVVMGFYRQCKDIASPGDVTTEQQQQHFLPATNTTFDDYGDVTKEQQQQQQFILPATNTTLDTPHYDTDLWCVDQGWVPLACLTLFMFTSSMGAGPVPSILNVEYFPTAVRAQLSGVCMVAGSGFNLMALQLFTPMQSAFTPAGLYWCYAVVCLFGVAFTLACVRETRGVVVG